MEFFPSLSWNGLLLFLLAIIARNFNFIFNLQNRGNHALSKMVQKDSRGAQSYPGNRSSTLGWLARLCSRFRHLADHGTELGSIGSILAVLDARRVGSVGMGSSDQRVRCGPEL